MVNYVKGETERFIEMAAFVTVVGIAVLMATAFIIKGLM